MARPLLLRLAFRVERLFCTDCDRIVWPWQERCRSSHSTCQHAAMRRQYQRNVEAGIGPERMWTCSACGRIP